MKLHPFLLIALVVAAAVSQIAVNNTHMPYIVAPVAEPTATVTPTPTRTRIGITPVVVNPVPWEPVPATVVFELTTPSP